MIGSAQAPVFDFGGVTMEFSCRNKRFMRLVHQRYEAFSTRQPPALRISYLVDGECDPHPRDLLAGRLHSIEARSHGTRYTLDGGTFCGEWDRAAGTMEIRGPLATYPVDRLIEEVVYATGDRVVILHAAALAFEGRGIICSGPSGSGKSTLAGLFPDNALCDEHVVVRIDGEAILSSSLPFWWGRRGTTPLAAIYLLEHATKNRRRRVSAREAATRLRPQVVWPTHGSDVLRRAFETFFGVIEGVPVWELGFRPDVSVREMLTEEGAE